jgi:hypothetical protein
MYIHRDITHHLNRLASKYPILAVTGPRQSGKTTLLQTIFPDYRYVSLENPDHLEKALSDPRSFLKVYDDKVIFDEAQRAPLLFSYLQGKVDADQRMGQYILSGSQNFLLMEKITQSLAGRVALFRLLPFSFNELESQNLMETHWQVAAFKGFYPTIFSRGLDPGDFFLDYISTYVERDVRQLVNIGDLRQFRIFLKMCAGYVGQMLNLQSLATDCGISQPTAKKWLSILETSSIVFTLPPYYRNFNKRLVKTPRLYFHDTGLVCYLLEMTRPADVETYFQKRALFENLIIGEFVKQGWNTHRAADFYFWRDNHQNEVDLLWEKQGKITACEIKSGATVSNSFFQNLLKFREMASDSLSEAFLFYGGEEAFEQFGVQVRGWRDLGSYLPGYLLTSGRK